MICSRQNTGDKVLASIYAHLLQPVIDRIDEAFRIRNEKKTSTPSPISYNMKDRYKPFVLRNINCGLGIDDEPTQLVEGVGGRVLLRVSIPLLFTITTLTSTPAHTLTHSPHPHPSFMAAQLHPSTTPSPFVS
jgi:hypothetical protein